MPDVELNWLLDDLAQRVSHIEQVLMLSRDGLAVGSSSGLGREDAERLSAIAAGFQSLGRGAAEYLTADRVRQIIVEMSGKFLFITASGEHGCLAVVTAEGADLGMVAYEMAMVANRVSGFMPAPRRSLQHNASGKL
jgi:predicted regulator of Ras-like GTPase activity (Roadblock/LC7/MglB family)